MVSDFLAEADAAFVGDASGEHSGGEASGLEDDDFAVGSEAMIEEDLGDLGRFAGAGGGLEDESGVGLEGGDESGLEFEDRKLETIQSEERIEWRGGVCARIKEEDKWKLELGVVEGCGFW